jgi:hypothetical protein
MAVMNVEVLGTVRPDGTLELDQKLNLPPGRVKVRLETVALTETKPAESLVDFVQRIRRALQAAGHRFRTKEEIDAELDALRSEWDERGEELDQLSSPKSATADPP